MNKVVNFIKSKKMIVGVTILLVLLVVMGTIYYLDYNDNKDKIKYIHASYGFDANNLNNIKKNPNFNNYLRRLNAAFTGYATFGYSNNEIQVINQLQDALCIGKLRK